MVHNAVEHGIGDGLLADHVVPALDEHLRGEHGRALLMPILDDIHQDSSRLGVEGLHSEIVENQQVDTFDTLEFGDYISFRFGDLQQAH